MHPRIEELAREIVAAGLAAPDELRGCTPEEIASIERKFNLQLPAAYRDWLLRMGRGAGQYLRGSDAFYPELLELREWAEELLIEDGRPFSLPPDAFVFLIHQGYQFLYFLTAPGDPDPPVEYYFSGEQRAGWSHLTDYFFQVVDDQRRLREP